MVPTGHLTGAAPARAIAGEPEAQFALIGNQPGTAGIQHTLQQNQHRHMDGEGVDVVYHKVRRTQGHGRHGHLAANGNQSAVKHGTDASQHVRRSIARRRAVNALNPLGKHRLQVNRRIGEHILRPSQRPAWCRCGCTARSCGSPKEKYTPSSGER